MVNIFVKSKKGEESRYFNKMEGDKACRRYFNETGVKTLIYGFYNSIYFLFGMF